ncbi:unnamed protein product [Rotaria sp. Silwood2]|nr:unnamed protein product [Rotaria sp. Silwood2]CAF2990728.1 unnamed protein product [Rotaria sp. Silwood2]CAF3017544.1 unnamed protein product [Rotaria sp. Silwood2]CAF3356461.1 unnamed protein product [Rotaria sp. Silwood2]CAF4041386.1 unnamed protein product [Rotaria sp. Silwood2]
MVVTLFVTRYLIAYLKQHHDTFTIEGDFREMTGFDNQLGGDPDGWKFYASDAINYFDRAIRENGHQNII